MSAPHIPLKNVDVLSMLNESLVEGSAEPSIEQGEFSDTIVPKVESSETIKVESKDGLGPKIESSPGVEAPVSKDSDKKQYSLRSKDKKALEEEKKLQQDQLNKSLLKQKTHNVIVQSRLKPVPFKHLDLYNFGPQQPQISPAFTIGDKGFYQTDDHPFNRRGFKYKPCQPNPIFKSNLYSTTDLSPFKVRISHFDRSNGIAFNKDLDTVSTNQGWRSVRSNVPIREGKYYFEFNIISANDPSTKGHVRVGVARKEASLEAPVGFDGYGYGLRDLNGQKMTLSRPKEFMSLKNDSDLQNFKSNDTIGFLIELPDLKKHREALKRFVNEKQSEKPVKLDESPAKKKRKTKKDSGNNDEFKFNLHDNILRDQIPIKYKNALYYEQFEYTPTKQMDHLLNPVTVFGEKAILEEQNNLIHSSQNIPKIPNSKIIVFKNGIEIGCMFEDLYSFLPVKFDDDLIDETISNLKQDQNSNYRNTDDGSLGYYPMLSVFLNGIVGLNPGPDFKYPIKDDLVKPLSDRFDESIVEEWMWDLIDEIELEYLDSFE